MYLIFILYFSLSLNAQSAPDFSGSPIKWLHFSQNKTESTEFSTVTGVVMADLLYPTYVLDLGENIYLVYEQPLVEGWIILKIETETGEVVWSKVVTRKTDNIPSFPVYLHQSSPNTLDLVGYERGSDPELQSIYSSHLFRSRISMEDGSVLETYNPTWQEGGTFVVNNGGAIASLVHNPNKDSFLIVEGLTNIQISPAGVWRFVHANSICIETQEHTFITGNRILNEDDGIYQDRVSGLEYLEEGGYILLLEEFQVDDFQNPTNYLELVKLNDNKEVEWRKVITEQSGIGAQLVVSNTSGYMVYGRLNQGSIPYDSDRPYYVSKFDENGDFLWRSDIEASNKIIYASSLQTEDGYLLAGVREDTEGFLWKCDEEGNLHEIANWKLENEVIDKRIDMYRAQELHTGDMMVQFSIDHDTIYQSPWGPLDNIIKKHYVVVFGKNDLFTDIEEPIANSLALTLYPNPSHDKVNITLPRVSTGTLQFYNTQGQLQRTVEVEGKQHLTISIEGLVNGLYYVHWSGEKGETMVKPLVIH